MMMMMMMILKGFQCALMGLFIADFHRV